MTTEKLTKKLSSIQRTIMAPKGRNNKFGGFNYRSAEDILLALKPLIGADAGVVFTLSDSIEMVGERVYVRATATITDGQNQISNTAYAREPLSKKGMDESQITGSASSYARKYALAGLLLLDDQKDPDSMAPTKEAAISKLSESERRLETLRGAIAAADSLEKIEQIGRDITSGKHQLHQSHMDKLHGYFVTRKTQLAQEDIRK